MNILYQDLNEINYEQDWQEFSEVEGDLSATGYYGGGLATVDDLVWVVYVDDSFDVYVDCVNLDGDVVESRMVHTGTDSDNRIRNGLANKDGEKVFYWLGDFQDYTKPYKIFWYDWDEDELGSWEINTITKNITSDNGVECSLSGIQYLDLAWTASNGLYMLAECELTYAEDHIRGPYDVNIYGVAKVDGDKDSFNVVDVFVFEPENEIVERIEACQNQIFIPSYFSLPEE